MQMSQLDIDRKATQQPIQQEKNFSIDDFDKPSANVDFGFDDDAGVDAFYFNPQAAAAVQGASEQG